MTLLDSLAAELMDMLLKTPDGSIKNHRFLVSLTVLKAFFFHGSVVLEGRAGHMCACNNRMEILGPTTSVPEPNS